MRRNIITFGLLLCVHLSLLPHASAETHVKRHPNGTVSFKWTTNDKGQVVGDAFAYYGDGQMARVTPHVEGKKHGIEKTFYPTGAIEKQHTYVDDNLEGEGYHYYANGNMYVKAQYKKGKYHGSITTYFNNGNAQPQIIAEYQDGLKHGSHKEFYEDGVLALEEQWAKDQPDGPWKSFYPDGMTNRSGTWVKGRKQGNEQYFYPNGMINVITPWKNHQIHGDLLEYHPAQPGQESQLAKITPHVKGAVKGTVIRYYRNGTKAEQSDYDGPVNTSNIDKFYDNGWQSEVIEVQNGKMVKHTSYYSDGRLKYITHYNNDQLHGKQQHYYPNAQLAWEKTWQNGVEVGKQKAFDKQGFPIK